MKKIFYSIALNPVFSNIVLVLVLVAGVMAINYMGRELYPDFTMDEIIIEVPYPGAGPSEVREGVILKIEEALDGMEGIASYSTRSEEDGGSAEIIVKHGYRSSEVMDRIRSKVGAISTFPEGSEKPIITEDINRIQVMKLYISADVSERRLKESAFLIRDELRMLEGISQIELFGIRDYEINVEISEERLRTFGVSFEDVAASIAENNLDLSCGVIRTGHRDIRIRTLGRKYTGEDLASVAVITEPGDSIVTLDRLADIKDAFTEESKFVTVNGKPAMMIEIYKTRREDAVRISETVRTFIKEKRSQLPDTFRFDVFNDFTDDLRSRIDLMFKNGIMGLCLVMVLLWIFLEFRLSFWAGVGIPVSILGALVVVWAMGGTINMLSLFGLITVLGIVVDDAIVVGEAVIHHYQKGLSPLEAVMEGIQEVGAPVTAAIATTVLAFLPMAFIGDVIGKFLSILPMVVIPCLIISLLECLFLLPAHLAHSLKKKRSKTDGDSKNIFLEKVTAFHSMIRRSLDRFAETVYLPFLTKALSYRYVVLCTVICLFCISVGVVWGGLVKYVVLPNIGNALISCSMKLNGGTSVNLTQKAVSQVENALLALSKNIQTEEGDFIINRMAVVGSTVSEDVETGQHAGGVQALMNVEGQPGSGINDFLLLWENAVDVITAAESIVFETGEEGPPGEAIEIRLRGRDLDNLKKAASAFIDELRKIDGVHQIRSDVTSRIDELHFTLKPGARFLGLTHNELAREIRAAFHGREAVRMQRGREDVRIKVRYTKREREKVAALKQMRIDTGDGYKIPLLSVADVAFSKGFEVIHRVDGLRCLTVTAAVDDQNADADQIISELSDGLAARLSEEYPGLDISFEGDEKHMKDALGGLYVGFPLAVLGIFIIVATMFRSYAQPFIILFAVPFGIIGGIFGHLVMGCELSLMSIFGLVALSGIVVNDAIILIERINGNLIQGMTFFRAVQQAGRRRFRAILLTTISTVGGLAPLVLEKSPQAMFLIPMAISITAGLILATILTPVLIPCLFTILNDLRLVFHRIRTGAWAEREILEPAKRRNYGINRNTDFLNFKDHNSNRIPL